MKSGYGVWINFEFVGEYETLALAQQAVEQSANRSQTNDQLVAAAPALLEAAKLLQAALSEYRLLDVRKRFSLSIAHAAAGAAIAKAEGR